MGSLKLSGFGFDGNGFGFDSNGFGFDGNRFSHLLRHGNSWLY